MSLNISTVFTGLTPARTNISAWRNSQSMYQARATFAAYTFTAKSAAHTANHKYGSSGTWGAIG